MRTTVSLQVFQVGIFGLAFAFVCHVDQIVETGTVQIASDERLELLSMQFQQFVNGFGECR